MPGFQLWKSPSGGVSATSRRRRFSGLWFLLWFMLPGTVHAQETPTVEEVREDIEAFQDFFLARFPSVQRDSYNEGAAGLPQYANYRTLMELLQLAPPQSDQLSVGLAAWTRPMGDGLSLEQCFQGNPPPFAYPYFFAGQVRTIAADINACRSRHDEPPLDPASGEMARLIAAFKAPWIGQPLDVDYREEEVRRLYAVGRNFFWTKRGQMNLSCANCHVHNAGNRLRGYVLSPALGHGTGYPAYSIRWSLQGEPMGTLYRQYALCNARAGATPLEPQSEPYIGLELYQAIMNSGIPLNAPGLRP